MESYAPTIGELKAKTTQELYVMFNKAVKAVNTGTPRERHTAFVTLKNVNYVLKNHATKSQKP